jgi:phosphoenolpyruvate synthase/pyruvate phosphate dikinase
VPNLLKYQIGLPVPPGFTISTEVAIIIPKTTKLGRRLEEEVKRT